VRVPPSGVPTVAADETAESTPDTAITVADNLARHAELMLIEEQIHSQERETRLDQLRMSFDEEQKEHAELLREMNALRDMATEQMKQDDANLKKWIALI
jgi:hypothetical protein